MHIDAATKKLQDIPLPWSPKQLLKRCLHCCLLHHHRPKSLPFPRLRQLQHPLFPRKREVCPALPISSFRLSLISLLATRESTLPTMIWMVYLRKWNANHWISFAKARRRAVSEENLRYWREWSKFGAEIPYWSASSIPQCWCYPIKPFSCQTFLMSIESLRRPGVAITTLTPLSKACI